MVIWTKVLWPFWFIQLRVFVYLWIIQNHIYIYIIYIYNKYDLYNIHWGPLNIAGQRRSGIGVPWEPWGAAVVSLLGSVGVPTQGEGCLLRFVQCVGAIQVPLRSLSFGEFWCLPKAVHPSKAASHMTKKSAKNAIQPPRSHSVKDHHFDTSITTITRPSLLNVHCLVRCICGGGDSGLCGCWGWKDRPFWVILDGICCPKYDRLTPRWLGEEEGGEKVHGLILGVLKGLTPRWLGEE